jgi:ribonuclease G
MNAKESHESGNLLLISVDEWECRAVVLERGRITEFYGERRFNKLTINSIFLGRVKEIRSSLKSAFINIGLSKNAFLSFENIYDSEELFVQNPKLEKGKEIIVQVVKPPHKSKGARVSAKISLAGRYAVYFPEAGGKFIHTSRKIPSNTADLLIKRYERHIPEKCGIILRTAAADAPEDLVLKELEMLCERWESIKRLASKKTAPAVLFSEDSFAVRVIREVYSSDQELVIVDDENAYREIKRYAEEFVPDVLPKLRLYSETKPLFEFYHVENQLNEIFARTITLPSGGYIVIDRREAMTVIDVNSGRHAGELEHEEMSMRVNLEAAEEIARQVRLRNISGIVVVDFIDVKKEEKKKMIFNYLSELLEKDRAYAYLESVPSLTIGIFTRKSMANVSYSFYEEECQMCRGSGWQISTEALAVRVMRKLKKIAAEKKEEAIVIRLNEAVYQEIRNSLKESLDEIQKKFKKLLILLGSDELKGDELEIVLVGKKDIVKNHFKMK